MPRKPIIYEYGSGKIELVQGILQAYPTQVIVCPADDAVSFQEGSVMGNLTMHSPSVARLLESYRKKLGKLEKGQVYIETTELLGPPLVYIFNVVTIYQDEREGRRVDNFVVSSPKTIRTATRNCLEVASALQLESIGFPLLGTGQGHLGLETCLRSMIPEITDKLDRKTSLRTIGIVIQYPRPFRDVRNILDSRFR